MECIAFIIRFQRYPIYSHLFKAYGKKKLAEICYTMNLMCIAEVEKKKMFTVEYEAYHLLVHLL